MKQRRRISRKQKRARFRNEQQARRAARHLNLGDHHDIDRDAAEAIRQFPNVPRLRQPPFPREREVGFVGHYLKGGFVAQEAEVFEAMNVAWRQDAWYWRHDKRGNRKNSKQDTGMVETNASLSIGLAKVVASIVEVGELKLAQDLAQTAGEAGMAELKARTGYEPAFMALHPDAYGTLSFHFGLWPVDRERRCLIGRSAGGKAGRRGLRSLGHAFISLLRHDEAIGLPENLTRRAKKNLAERDSDDWAVSIAMDLKLRSELSKLPNGQKLLAQADVFQRAAAEDWLNRFYASKNGVTMLKAERDQAVEMAKRQKVAAAQMSRRLNEQSQAIKGALREMGVAAEGAKSGMCGVLIRQASRVTAERKQAAREIQGTRDELVETRTKLNAARERIAVLESEKATLKELAMNLINEIRSSSVNFGKKGAAALRRLRRFLGLGADKEEPESMANRDDIGT